MVKAIEKGRVGRMVAICYVAIFTVLVVALHVWAKENPTFTASPRLPFVGSIVRFRLVIRDTDEKFRCPGIRWIMPDETKAYEESDCSPEDKPDYQSWNRDIVFRVPGEYTICVQVEKPENKVVSKKCMVITVH